MIHSEIHIPTGKNEPRVEEIQHEFSHNIPLLERQLCGKKYNHEGHTRTFTVDSCFQSLFILRESQKSLIFGNTVGTTPSYFLKESEKFKPPMGMSKQIQDKRLSHEINGGTISSTRPKTSKRPCRILPEDTIIYNDALKFKNRVRFNRTHDCRMFHTLLQICEKNQTRIEEFWNSFDTLKKVHVKILKELSDKVMWKRKNFVSLHSRIRKIGEKRHTFTVREVKFLKKMVNKQQRKGRTDFNELVYYFPGKKEEQLIRKYNEESRISSENSSS
ncbi:unnamed protein product [Moneuplotes crassus]|uniref:Uncharacterized protein n=1 Tax=Euplotes crassus TaxID=5936 RepID=A0AAD1XA05_EUPCR|nr:unnamed protein product [Moneuplotes crassus]